MNNNISMSYLSESFNVHQGLEPVPEGVDDAHVVVLLQERVLRVLEDADGVSEQDLLNE